MLSGLLMKEPTAIIVDYVVIDTNISSRQLQTEK